MEGAITVQPNCIETFCIFVHLVRCEALAFVVADLQVHNLTRRPRLVPGPAGEQLPLWQANFSSSTHMMKKRTMVKVGHGRRSRVTRGRRSFSIERVPREGAACPGERSRLPPRIYEVGTGHVLLSCVLTFSEGMNIAFPRDKTARCSPAL